MEKVTNLGIPHVSEQIFDGIDTPGLVKCQDVSKPWKVLTENILAKRWRGKIFEACQSGKTKIVQLLLEHCSPEESGLNTRDKRGRTPFMVACWNGHTDVVQLLPDTSERSMDLNAELFNNQ